MLTGIKLIEEISMVRFLHPITYVPAEKRDVSHIITYKFSSFFFKLNIDFAGKAAQQIGIPVPEGCTDPIATNFDPTARSDDGTCSYSV